MNIEFINKPECQAVALAYPLPRRTENATVNPTGLALICGDRSLIIEIGLKYEETRDYSEQEAFANKCSKLAAEAVVGMCVNCPNSLAAIPRPAINDIVSKS